MSPQESIEFWEHVFMYIGLIGLLLFSAHWLVLFVDRRLRKRFNVDTNKETKRKIQEDAALSFRMAASVNADAQCFRDQLVGGKQ